MAWFSPFYSVSEHPIAYEASGHMKVRFDANADQPIGA
jgi:hypothetical protein